MILNSDKRRVLLLAKRQGKRLGRPPVEITAEFIEAYKEWKSVVLQQ